MSQLRIRGARDLFEALRSPALGVRIGMLQAISSRPELAIACGPFEGRDVIDELIDQAARLDGGGLWRALAEVLARFADPRVRDYFLCVLARSETATVVLFAAGRLKQEPLGPMAAQLTAYLMQTRSEARARAAAELLAPMAEELSPAERARLLVLSGELPLRPNLEDEAERRAWIAEVDGPYAASARRRLESSTPDGWQKLAEAWERLSPSARAWLLRSAAPIAPKLMMERLPAALVSEDVLLCAAALEILPVLGAGAGTLQAALTRLATHEDPAIRRAALRAGAPGIDHARALKEETDTAVRIVHIERLGAKRGAAAIRHLLRLLEEPQWQLRAAATRALVAVGAAAVEPVRACLDLPAPGVRIAAAQALMELGDAEWLAAWVERQRPFLPGTCGFREHHKGGPS